MKIKNNLNKEIKYVYISNIFNSEKKEDFKENFPLKNGQIETKKKFFFDNNSNKKIVTLNQEIVKEKKIYKKKKKFNLK